MMKKRYLLLGIVGFVVFYISRPWLPMLYWGDSIEVEINLPAHLVPSVGGEYSSTSCQSLTTSDFSWINGRRSGDARLEKISDTQYRAKVYFKDMGPCGWRLTAIAWNLEYKDPGSILAGATDAGGGGNTIQIVDESFLSASQREQSNYSDQPVMVITRHLKPHVYIDTEKWFFLKDMYHRYPFYYNPYKHVGQAKIVYNVTVDESSLKGLTADEAYRLQEERLARERKEKQEKEEEELRQYREERDAYLRELALKDAAKMQTKQSAGQ